MLHVGGLINIPAPAVRLEAAVVNSAFGMSPRVLRSFQSSLIYSPSGTTDAYCGANCQPSFGTCTGTPPPPPPPSTLSSCLNSKNVPIRLISSPDFGQLSKPYNLRLPYTPAVIVLPTTVKHVSDAVVCASQSGVKVQAKSGGHSYASYGFGGKSGGMTIDLQSFQEITLDSNFVAKVGGGVRLGNLALGIFNQNNAQRALPHGTCPGVGVGGHATHGGYGYSSRSWGLALDTITAMDVTLANGSSIRTTPTSYPDIFYVCSQPSMMDWNITDMKPGASGCCRFFRYRDKLLHGDEACSPHRDSMVISIHRHVLVCCQSNQCILEYSKLCAQFGCH
jgi:hypothetical protein